MTKSTTENAEDLLNYLFIRILTVLCISAEIYLAMWLGLSKWWSEDYLTICGIILMTLVAIDILAKIRKATIPK